MELVFKMGSTFMCNRLFYHADFITFNPVDLPQVGSWSLFWVSTYYLDVISQEVTFEAVRVRNVDSTYGPWVVGSAGSTPGRAVDQTMSANIAMRVREKWAPGKPKRRGCFFTVGVPRFAVVENQFTDAYISGINDAWSNAFEIPLLPGYEWSWASFQHNYAWRSVAVTHTWGIMEFEKIVCPRRRRLRNTTAY